MKFSEIDRILKEEPDKAAEELLKRIDELYGEIPYIHQFMKDKPDLLIPKVLYDNSIMREFNRLDHKTIELISIAVASALKCDHCLDMHLRIAQRMGLSRDEIFDAILIAGTLSNASVLANGTRAMDREIPDENSSLRQKDKKCEICDSIK